MENYDLKIGDEKKRATKAAYLFRLATEHMTYKNNRQEKNIVKLYFQLTSVPSYEEKVKIKHKLTNAFKGLPDQDLISSVKLERIMQTDFYNKHLGKDHREIVKLSIELANDLKASAIKYLDEYITCYWRIKLLEQERMEQENALKVPSKPKQTNYKPTQTETRSTTDYEQPISRYGIPQPREPKPKLYSSRYMLEDEAQKEMNANLLKMLQEKDNWYNRGLSYELKDEVREVYKGRNAYAFADVVSDAIEMNQIANEYAQMNTTTKKLPVGLDPRVNDIMKLAINCYNVTVYQLKHEFGEGNTTEAHLNSRDLLHKLNADSSLAIYQQTYDMFMKYYGSLDEAQRQNIKNHIDQYGYEYKKVFNIPDNYPRIVDTRDIINAVNRAMSARIKESFAHIDIERSSLEFNDVLRSSTRYMKVDEIVQLYKQIKFDSARDYSTVKNEEQREALEREYKRKMEILQDAFIQVIKRKIRFNVEYDVNMPKDEQERATRMMNVQSAMIANDFFHEELLFNPYNIKNNQVQQGVAKRKSEFMEEAQKAEERFFGMGKLKQALAKSSSYKKLIELIEKQNVTEEDIAFAKKLY